LRITQETIEDAATAELAGRVSVSHDPDLDRHYPEDYPSRVRLTTVDGETYERQELAAWGSIAKPLSEADLRRKLLALAEPRLGEGAEAVWELLQSPQGARIGDLVELLGAARA
jgi:2-methylcitrate dehydratase PrpD